MLWKLIRKPKMTDEDIEIVFQHVIHNRRAEYFPIAIELLKSRLLRTEGGSTWGRPNCLDCDLILSSLRSDATDRQKADGAIDYLSIANPKYAAAVYI